MVTSEFSYFLIGEMALSLLQEAAKNNPLLMPFSGPVGRNCVQRGLSVFAPRFFLLLHLL